MNVIMEIIFLYLPVQPDQNFLSAKRQETVIMNRFFESRMIMEQRELITVRCRVIRTEHSTVAALIAHPVHVENLVGSIGHFNDHIGPVGTHIGTALADHIAAEAAVTFALGRQCQNALLGIGSFSCGTGLRRVAWSEGSMVHTSYNGGCP